MTSAGESELRDLYRQTVLDHSRNPRNFRRLDDPDAVAEGHNPLCGDKVTVYVKLDDGTISDVTFEGVGCAISRASASIMTEQVRKQTTREARDGIDSVIGQFDRERSESPAGRGDMAALGGVREYPSRIKCATLPWKTLGAALDGTTRPVTTED